MPLRRPGLTLLLIALACGAGGCGSRTSGYCVPKELARPGRVVPTSPAWDEPGAGDTELLKSLADRLGPPDASAAAFRPKSVLVLSGGGMYGAYAVGVLCGWSAAGDRPPFDVVTGVSTGALIATYAFLGSSYDPRLATLYTTVTTRDIYRRRSAVRFLTADAVASSAPLKRLIDDEVSDDVIRAVAQAHQSGRRLYIGTTNLGTRRLVMWDMGAIAASGRPDAKELYRKVLLASASVPGLLPPVQFDVTVNGRRFTEQHVDGGATTGLVLRGSTLGLTPDAVKAGARPLAGSNVYVIVSGKLYADPDCPEARALRIGADGVQSLVYSQTRGELSRIFTLCVLGGMRFNLASIPEDLPTGGDGMEFDPTEMRRLYGIGYATATAGKAWKNSPPGAEADDHGPPRSGNEFFAPVVPEGFSNRRE